MYKNLKTLAAEWLENGNNHVDRKHFNAKQHSFKWIPAPEIARNQETNIIKVKQLVFAKGLQSNLGRVSRWLQEN